jgi:hypothetical protein
MRILFVSANPDWTPRLDLLDELRELNRSLKGKSYELELLPAAQPEDLIEAVEGSDKPIDILHFSGHATEKHGLFFRSSDNGKEMLTAGDLEGIFKENPVKLAFLNACHTKSTAEGIKGVANTVIGTTEKLDDEAAKKMTKVLYAALGNGKSIDKAYAEAIEIVKETGFEDVYMTDRAEGRDEPELTFTPGDVEIDPENEDKWDRHFFERYLEEQINSLTDSVKLNRQILFALLGLGLLMITVSWMESIYFRLDAAEKSWLDRTWEWVLLMGSDIVSSISSIVNALLGRALGSLEETPLLEWLKKMGEAVPLLVASLQHRWCVHGNEKIRQLKALKELVEHSDTMSDTLRIRLHKILDQSVRAANFPPPDVQEPSESEQAPVTA